jgi:hypothetical protein
MIEYKTRYRASSPKKGDGVWIEGKIPEKPMAIGANGRIVRIDWQAREAMVLFTDPAKQLTFEFDDLKSCWNDVLNSYIVEEPYVTNTLNDHDNNPGPDDDMPSGS